MRRSKLWLSAWGLLALTPGITLAGPLSLGRQVKESTPPAAVRQEQARNAPNSNQEVAEQIAKSLRKANLSGYDVDIVYKNGVAVLNGAVGSPEQKLAATRAASGVKGVSKVDNRLAVVDAALKKPSSGVEQAAFTPAPQSRPSAALRQPIRRVNFQEFEGQEPVQIPAHEAVPMNPLPGAAGQYSAAPPQAYAPSATAASHTVYNQPNMPNMAWPAYAQYPNYAATSYPSQYSASAWPYIGPFYPYPQVPLGWRKAQLEWDDGYWHLNFRPRTDRWWWFLDHKNW